jgi:UDP-N-acetylglucosamine:LPS N-acetylglucosamine transferase
MKEKDVLKRRPRVCLIASSGGHWEQIKKFQVFMEKYDCTFVTEKTEFKESLAKYLMMQTDLRDRLMIFKMAVNLIRALRIWFKEKPDFIITTGTIIAYPFYLLSILFKKKFVFIETFGRADMPTVAGRMMEKHSDLFIVQWEKQKKYYKKAIYGGCLY